MKKKMLVLSLLAVCFFFASCASTGSVKPATTSIKILETIPNISTPEWVDSTNEFWQEKDSYVYRSTSEGMTNLTAAKRAAQANAQTNIAEQVKNVVRVEFAQAMEAGAYDATTGGYLKDTFFSVVNNLTLSGVKITSSYVQRISETNSSGERLYYRAYALASLSQEDYKKLVQRAFTDTSAQVSANKSAKELVAETEKRFWAAEDSTNK